MGSSIKGESSYSHVTDGDVGLSLIDRFTWSTLDFFERVGISSNANMAQLARIYRCAGGCCHYPYAVCNRAAAACTPP
jgi:glycosylphosphatidylinositol transamidase (GPIT) subunit GPI8